MSDVLGLSLLGGASVAAIVLGIAEALASGSRRRRDRLARFGSTAGAGPLATAAPSSAPLVRSLASVGRLPARWLGLRADAEVDRLLDSAGRPSSIDANAFVQARAGAALLGAALLGTIAV